MMPVVFPRLKLTEAAILRFPRFSVLRPVNQVYRLDFRLAHWSPTFANVASGPAWATNHPTRRN
jgi:hypothetical protein